MVFRFPLIIIIVDTQKQKKLKNEEMTNMMKILQDSCSSLRRVDDSLV